MFGTSDRIKHCLAAAAGILTALIMLVSLPGCFLSDMSADKESYEKGCAYYEDGLYKEAKECFLAANGYSNTEEFLAAIAEYEQYYLDGIDKVSSHEYEQAYEYFRLIPKYENSQEYMDFIDSLAARFAEGVRLYEQGQYLAARSAFVEASGYSNSESYLENIDSMASRYNLAVEFMNEGKYFDAITAFESIGAVFEDSDSMAELCWERLLTKPVTPEEYIHNFNEQYPDGSISIGKGNIEGSDFSLTDSRGVRINGNTNKDGNIRLIDFIIPEDLLSELSEHELSEFYAGFIHALNPYAMAMDDLIALLSDGISDGINYGCMFVTVKVFAAERVLEAAMN